MTGFRFKAHTASGQSHTGVIQAITAEEVERILVRQKLIPDQIKPEPLDRSLQLRRTPSPAALVQFARQFATLVEAGVPLLLSLEILDGLTDDRPLRRALGAVASDVNSGSTLTDAMRRHPRCFSDIFIHVVEAGEEGGTLDAALLLTADYLERSHHIRDKVRAAMIYPMVIVLAAVGSIAALLTLVVPTFEGMFAASGMELPFATQALVTASDFIGTNLLVLLWGTLVGALVGKTVYDTETGARLVHRVVLRIPVVGRLIRKIAAARVARTTASLLSSGVSILDALVAGGRTAGNVVIADALFRARDAVAGGSSVSDALASHRVLPELMAKMVSIGEQTGRLDTMLTKVAVFYEREVETEIDGLLKALEPALVVLVGVILGGIVVAMYLPIFDAIGAVDPVS